MKRYHKDTKKFFLAISSAFSDKKKEPQTVDLQLILAKRQNP